MHGFLSGGPTVDIQNCRPSGGNRTCGPAIPVQLLVVETTDNFTVHYAKLELIEQHFTISKSTDKEA
jgi:hypothetical protein